MSPEQGADYLSGSAISVWMESAGVAFARAMVLLGVTGWALKKQSTALARDGVAAGFVGRLCIGVCTC